MTTQTSKRPLAKNEPCFDGRALAILIFIVLFVIAAVWFGHSRLETSNDPATQQFQPKATPNH